jgi:hypothetical protein
VFVLETVVFLWVIICAPVAYFHNHPPPRLTLLKVMAQGAPMKNFGGNKMFAVFDLLKIRNSRQ